MGYLWRRAVIAVVVIGGFAAYLASVAFEWRVPLWVYLVAGMAALLLISLLSFRPRRRTTAAELSASDPYSDAYLGRAQPIHPHRETRSASQIDDGLPPDPMRLPPERPSNTPPAHPRWGAP
ncbi:hypothetical protein [Microbacterium sp. P05]|uniref:hypothetical protein n=1 Tax=Microbacterium sp. P05 TaxID=3366948 RepID=UPI003744CF34